MSTGKTAAGIRSLFQPPVFEDDERTRSARVLYTTLQVNMLVDGLIATTPLFFPISAGPTWACVGALLALQVGLLLAARRGHIAAAGWAFGGMLWLVFTGLAVFFGGATGAVPPSYGFVILISALVLGEPGAIVFTVLTVLAEAMLLCAGTRGLLPDPALATPPAMFTVVRVASFALLGYSLFYAFRLFNRLSRQASYSASHLTRSNADLEARSRELGKKNRQLEAAAEVSRAAILVDDIDALLSEATRLISESFGFYHTGVFLLDDEGQYAVLRAASSPGGQQLVSEGHRLRVGQQGIVGYVTSEGEPRIALDVGSDTVHFSNPLLPGTRSEMALPLKAGERIIGALDVQSREAHAFDDNDLAVLQMMADHLAVSIDNARLLGATQHTVGELTTTAAEILTATTQQATGATEQATAISQTTTTVDEVKVISEQAIQRAQEVVDASQRTVRVSGSGQQSVQETLQSMNEIKNRVESIAENILALSEQTQQIGEIIASVNEIAAQSNMLALNASVEAARAGEHGKGFAVVAAEVRNLAEQSRQATAQVKAILLDIQNGINATVMATEEGTKVVEQGVHLATQTGQVIKELAGTIEEAAQAATQVRAGGQQQATGVEQIALAMQSINQATAQTLSSSRQTESAAQDLDALARTLTQMVERYQL